MNLKYSLTGTGWSAALLEAGENTATVTASYLSDALGELARGALAVLRGNDEVRFSFDEEPGEYRWILRRQEGGRFTLTILWFTELWGNEADEAGTPVFEQTMDGAGFAKAVWSALEDVLHEYGEAGYKEKWAGHDFPAKEMAELHALLNEHGRVCEDYYAWLKTLPSVAKDFTTPEGAILCLEDAYRRRDIGAAIAAKDFLTEGRLVLEKSKFRDFINEETIALAAEALMLTFRACTTAEWPDFDGLESFFTEREFLTEKVVLVTEVCRFPDGGFSSQKIHVSETPEGWRVLMPIRNDLASRTPHSPAGSSSGTGVAKPEQDSATGLPV